MAVEVNRSKKLISDVPMEYVTFELSDEDTAALIGFLSDKLGIEEAYDIRAYSHSGKTYMSVMIDRK